ncbi:hypothetical protein F4859DRAFT_494739 [Xylaria cf. heliscus]|nr:hypothetical protein F4859DRAFT_494739 [Xylaria cf. heliscus]
MAGIVGSQVVCFCSFSLCVLCSALLSSAFLCTALLHPALSAICPQRQVRPFFRMSQISTFLPVLVHLSSHRFTARINPIQPLHHPFHSR